MAQPEAGGRGRRRPGFAFVSKEVGVEGWGQGPEQQWSLQEQCKAQSRPGHHSSHPHRGGTCRRGENLNSLHKCIDLISILFPLLHLSFSQSSQKFKKEKEERKHEREEEGRRDERNKSKDQDGS